jgi:hypothetical protein
VVLFSRFVQFQHTAGIRPVSSAFTRYRDDGRIEIDNTRR